MTALVLTVLAVVCALLLGEAALWKLLVRRLDPKRSLVDEDLARSGLFPMRRIRIAAICHAAILGIVLVIPLLALW